MSKKPNMREVAGEDRKPEPTEMVKDVAYLQSPVINSVKPKPKPSKEAGSNSYAKDNQAAIKKLKA